MAAASKSISQPDLTVAAIVHQDGLFLVVEEKVRSRIVINQPAGHVEAGESLTDAVIRETLEETAWTFEPEGIVGIYLWQGGSSSAAFLRIAFHGRCVAHDANRSLDRGILRALWLSPAELAARSSQLRSPIVLKGIEDFLAGARYPLDLVMGLGVPQLLLRAARV